MAPPAGSTTTTTTTATTNMVEAALKADDLDALVTLGDRLSAKTGNAGADAVEAIVASSAAVVRSIGRLLEAKALDVLQTIAEAGDAANEDDKTLCQRALAAMAAVTRRVLEHGGVAAPAALKPVATLLHDMVLLAPEFPTVTQDAVAAMCEAWWHAEKPGREEIVTKTAPYLVVLALTTGRGAEVKRLNAMRTALALFDWDDETSILSVKKLLLRCAFAPHFLRGAEGRRFLSFLFTLHPGTTRDLMAIVRNQIPAGRRAVLEHYGDVLFRAWRSAGDDCLREIERAGVQGLAESALLASTPQMAANLRVVLDGFHAQKAHRGVDAMLLRLYEPILFRALSAANPAVRRNACALLVDVFPLQDPDADVEETDALLARQAGIINQLMGDAAPAVRAAAVEGICKILNVFWELIPAPTTAAFLAKLVDDLARDASSASVRAAVLEGLTKLVDNPLAQPVLKAVLPRLAPLIGDANSRVRVALADLLIAVKSVRSIHFYDVVPLEDILLALGGGGGPAVAGRLTRLLAPTYLPLGKEPAEVARRLAALTARDADAAAALCRHAVKEGTPTAHAAATCRALAASLKGSGVGIHDPADPETDGKAKGRRKRAAEKEAEDAHPAAPPTTPEWIATARALAELAAAVRDAPGGVAGSVEEGAEGAAALTPPDIAALLKAAPSKAARAHVLRAAAASVAAHPTNAAAERDALGALKRSLLASVTSSPSPPPTGSEAEDELAASLEALAAWGAAGDLSASISAALDDAARAFALDADADADEFAPAAKRARPGTAMASAATALRCLRLLLRSDANRVALLEAAALEPLTASARGLAQAHLADPARAAFASPSASLPAAEAATAYGRAAMHLALCGGGASVAVAAIEDLLGWTSDENGDDPSDLPGPIVAALVGLFADATELGLLDDAPDAARRVGRFGGGAVVGLSRGRSEDAKVTTAANRAAARLTSNLAASHPVAAAELAATLMSRAARSARAAAGMAPALPALLGGMLKARRDDAGEVGGATVSASLDASWLAPVAAGAATLLRAPGDANDDDAGAERRREGSMSRGDEARAPEAEDEDEDVVALPRAVLAAARFPAQQQALAAALATYVANRMTPRGTDDNDAAAVGEVRGATALLQRLTGVHTLPAAAAASLRAARDAAVDDTGGDRWAANGVAPALTVLAQVMA